MKRSEESRVYWYLRDSPVAPLPQNNKLKLIAAARSAAFLPEESALRRLPRAPGRQRPAEFYAAFEDRALVYDCFWHEDGKRVLLVGPPPMGLRQYWREARFVAAPSNSVLTTRFHPSLSTMIIELAGAPANSCAIVMRFDNEEYELPIGRNFSRELAGRRVLFAMSRNNDLAWIREWAHWHTARNGTNAVIVFDNGSDQYAPGDIEETLLSVSGLETISVPSWPGAFGMTDKALSINPYWPHFLQISAMSVALRRFAMEALGLLNCDPDELASTQSGRSIYALLDDARHGLVVFGGQWIEAVAEPGAGAVSHRSFRRRLTDTHAARSRPGKWVLDPKQEWMQRLDVHPYWHWVAGRPWFGKSMPKDAFYWHFMGINTGWKEERGKPRGATEVDERLATAYAEIPDDD